MLLIGLLAALHLSRSVCHKLRQISMVADAPTAINPSTIVLAIAITSFPFVFWSLNRDYIKPTPNWLQAASLEFHRFPDEDPNGPVDAWLNRISIPPIDSHTPHRVALVCLWLERELPDWFDYFAAAALPASKKGLPPQP